MGDITKCPSNYETYIDLYQDGHVKYVVWQFFRKMETPGIAECNRCNNEIGKPSQQEGGVSEKRVVSQPVTFAIITCKKNHQIKRFFPNLVGEGRSR